jgi:pimeloyl-ACP methyl ester carboxylesterase
LIGLRNHLRERDIRGRSFKVSMVAAALLATAVAAALMVRTVQQHKIARQLKIDTRSGVDEEGFVTIGGVRQWVQIRGEDRNNPVLLIVHGGPGVSLMAYTSLFRKWERHYTIVQWDQRGDGKTFGANPLPKTEDMKIVRVADDGVGLTEYLRRRLHKDRVVLLGHSWGGAVALTMVQARPDLFSAFIATGFVVSEEADWKAGYHLLVDRARQDGNSRAVSELNEIGPPPYRSKAAVRIRSRWIAAYDHGAEKRLVRRAWRMALFAPNYSIKDIWDFFAAMRFSERTAGKWLYEFDARRLNGQVNVPVYFLEGDRDFTTPIPIVRTYLDGINAPAKHFIVLPGCGHSALITDPDLIETVLVGQVRPAISQ